MREARLFKTVSGIASSPRTIFLVALAARLWVLSQLLPVHAWRDFYQYSEPARIAWAVASGYGYSSPYPHTPLAPTAQQPPVYPLLIAGIFKLAGAYTYWSLLIAVGLNAVLSAFTAVLILKIGRKTFGASVGVLAAWVWSCWLYEAVVAIRLWESSLSALLLAIGLWLLPELAGSLRVWRWLGFGALVGVAALCNTTLLSVFPFFWLWLWLSYHRRGRSYTRWLLASIAVCILLLLPWTIRNYAAFHRLLPIRDNLGLELWIGFELGEGNHSAIIQDHLFPRDFPLADPREYNRLGEIGFMEAKRQMSLDLIRQDPGRFVHLCGWRCLRFWSRPEETAWPWVSLLAWLGLALAIRRKGLAAMPYAIVLTMFPLVYYVTHTFPTYRHPIEPVIILLAAYTLVSGGETFARRFKISGLLRDFANHPPEPQQKHQRQQASHVPMKKQDHMQWSQE